VLHSDSVTIRLVMPPVRSLLLPLSLRVSLRGVQGQGEELLSENTLVCGGGVMCTAAIFRLVKS